MTESETTEKRSYFKKLIITFGVVALIITIVAGAIAAIIGAWLIGRALGGHGGGTIGACIAVVILFCLAFASTDWDSEDGY